MRFQFVHQHRELWPIDLQCRILEVSRQGYYQWLDQTPSARAEKQQAIVSQIKRIHTLHRHDVYGRQDSLARKEILEGLTSRSLPSLKRKNSKNQKPEVSALMPVASKPRLPPFLETIAAQAAGERADSVAAIRIESCDIMEKYGRTCDG